MDPSRSHLRLTSSATSYPSGITGPSRGSFSSGEYYAAHLNYRPLAVILRRTWVGMDYLPTLTYFCQTADTTPTGTPHHSMVAVPTTHGVVTAYYTHLLSSASGQRISGSPTLLSGRLPHTGVLPLHCGCVQGDAPRTHCLQPWFYRHDHTPSCFLPRCTCYTVALHRAPATFLYSRDVACDVTLSLYLPSPCALLPTPATTHVPPGTALRSLSTGCIRRVASLIFLFHLRCMPAYLLTYA